MPFGVRAVNRPVFLKGEAVKSCFQSSVSAPPRRRKAYSRPSLLDRVKLSDGRLALGLAAQVVPFLLARLDQPATPYCERATDVRLLNG